MRFTTHRKAFVVFEHGATSIRIMKVFRKIPLFITLVCGLSLSAGSGNAGEALSMENNFLKSSSWYVGAELASAYLGSSGAIYDTRPIFSQETGWHFDFGDYGWIDGYFWIVSSLHNRQRESHRVLFNEYETTICYGQTWKMAEKVALKAKVGPLWNPAIGYHDSHNNYWGPYMSVNVDNPIVVPYAKGLWLLAPKMRGRICFGLQKHFDISEKWSITPMAETVWNDRRRFSSRYGSDPDNAIFGGSFASITTGARVTWKMTENLQTYFRFLMFDVINSQAREALKKQDAYYAKCDWPVFRLGVEYSF